MMFRDSGLRGIVAGTTVAALAACTGPMGGMLGGKSEERAVANLQSTHGNFALGTVTFTQAGDHVVVTADVRGLPANAVVGFHVHEKGDCSSDDGMSAGPHFNPLKKPHGQGPDRHVGDMPNLKADPTGRALYRAELDLMTVADGPTSVVGKSVIVHRDPDDYTSQPAGNAGPRIACGVIQRVS